MKIVNSGAITRVSARAYGLRYDAREPWMLSLERGGRSRHLSLAAGVHPVDGWDALGTPRLESAEEAAGEAVLRFAFPSRAWSRMSVLVRCREDDLDFQVVVEGKGAVESVSLLEGAVADRMPHPRCALSRVQRSPRPLRAYSLPSPAAHATVFHPQPTAEHRPVRPAHEDLAITAACTFGPEEFNTFFSPGIFCFVLGDADGREFLSAGIFAPPGQNLYHTFRYRGGEGYGFALDYDGKVAVDGRFESPRLRLAFADGWHRALEEYAGFLRANGFAPAGPAPAHGWWRKPIFCGWGQQTHWARLAARREGLPFDAGPVDLSAAGMATQTAYEEMVRILEAADLPYGTLIVDLGWSRSRSLPEPDPEKWPDLAGFIAGQHRRGKKVLLWLGCWDADGVPAEWLMARDEGLRDVVDPTHPGFAGDLRRRIGALLALDGLDADGFKLDFSGDLPRGRGYRPRRPLWGVELLRAYLEIIHSSAKAAKPDALIVTHCATPYLADLTDMLRLNDIFFETTEVNAPMAFRAEMAKIACPDWLIDCDNDPFLDRESWMNYLRFQPRIGVPSLYTLTNMSMSGEPAAPGDLKEIAGLWRGYLTSLPPDS